MIERVLDPSITIRIVIRVDLIGIRIEREGVPLGTLRFRPEELHRLLAALRDILEPSSERVD